MTDFATYRATLDGLESELAKAETRVARLKAGIAAIREIIGPDASYAGPSLVADASGDGEANGPPSIRRPDPQLTMRELAIIALESGKPMRMREIFDTLTAMGLKYPRGFDVFKGSMAPTLNRENATFEKVEQGLFTLKNHTAPSD
jgi:hypothetical protein